MTAFPRRVTTNEDHAQLRETMRMQTDLRGAVSCRGPPLSAYSQRTPCETQPVQSLRIRKTEDNAADRRSECGRGGIRATSIDIDDAKFSLGVECGDRKSLAGLELGHQGSRGQEKHHSGSSDDALLASMVAIAILVGCKGFLATMGPLGGPRVIGLLKAGGVTFIEVRVQAVRVC